VTNIKGRIRNVDARLCGGYAALARKLGWKNTKQAGWTCPECLQARTRK
jgi:hypothetical protein